MFNSIWSDIKREVAQGNMVTRIVIVNIGVWVVMILAKLFLNGFGLYEPLLHSLSISTEWKHMLFNPWSLVTYMFLHEGLWHLIFNLLVIYWFGRILGDFIGDKRILPLYFMGGLMGAIFFFLSMNLIKAPGQVIYCLGASAAAMAFVFGSATLSPNYEMRLILLGSVKIKYIAFALLLIDLASIANSSNTGGHISHLGGAVMGSLYIFSLRRGDDLAVPFNQLFDWVKSLFEKPAPQPKRQAKVRTLTPPKSRRSVFRDRGVSKGSPYDGMSDQEKLDAILDKINIHGIDQLSDEERNFLKEASKK